MNDQNIFQKLASSNEQSNFLTIEPNQEQEPNGNIFEKLSKKQEEKKQDEYGFFDTLKDVVEQVATKGPAGITGAYGNILDALGLQTKEGELLPGKERQYSRQFELLQKQEKEPLSFGELMELSEDDYPITRLPTSKEIQKGIENITGIGEGKTSAGRIAGRGTEFVGEGLATGGTGKALAVLGASGLAGQGIREAGGPEMAASALEIGVPLLHGAVSNKLTPTSKAAKELTNAGRSIGLTEKQITPLIQKESKVATLSKVSRKSERTKELFSSIKESLGNSYDNIKKSVASVGRIGPANEKNLIDKFTDIKIDLEKTLKASPDKEAAINFISNAIEKVKKNGATPEEMINFWQDINKSVKWNSIQGGKKALTRLKEPLLDTLEKVTPQAAKDFEMTNQLYSKYAQISKKLKPDMLDAFLSKGELLAVGPTGYALANGNPWPLASLAGEAAVRTLAEEMLTNPYFQNVANKLVKNFNQASVKGVTDSVKQVREYMERKHPNEDWSFLNED